MPYKEGHAPTPTCGHPDVPYAAKGLCRNCYMAAKRGRKGRPSARIPECHPDRRHKADGLCAACYEVRRTQREREQFPPTEPLPRRMATCHPERPHFAKNLCRACYAARWRAGGAHDRMATCHPDRPEYARRLCQYCFTRPTRRAHQLRQLYGPGAPERYEASFLEQGGRCAICGQPESSKLTSHLSVDHDHATNEWRGLLCNSCNNGLGRFKDEPAILLAAIAYLEAHKNQ